MRHINDWLNFKTDRGNFDAEGNKVDHDPENLHVLPQNNQGFNKIQHLLGKGLDGNTRILKEHFYSYRNYDDPEEPRDDERRFYILFRAPHAENF